MELEEFLNKSGITRAIDQLDIHIDDNVEFVCFLIDKLDLMSKQLYNLKLRATGKLINKLNQEKTSRVQFIGYMGLNKTASIVKGKSFCRKGIKETIEAIRNNQCYSDKQLENVLFDQKQDTIKIEVK